MRNLIQASLWTAAIAGFFFLGGDLYAQRFVRTTTTTVVPTPRFNPNLFRQQSLIRPTIPSQQPLSPAARNVAFLNLNGRFANPFLNPNAFAGFNNPFVNQNRFFNPFLTPNGFGNFNNGFSNFNNRFANPFLTPNGFANFNPYFATPYANWSPYYNTSFGNPYINPGAYFNPYASPAAFSNPFGFANFPTPVSSGFLGF